MSFDDFNTHIKDLIIPAALTATLWASFTNLLNVAAVMFLPSGWGQAGVALFGIIVASFGLYWWNRKEKAKAKENTKEV